MNNDGVLYADMAKNMAHGIGGMWSPQFTQYFWTHFYEHPSLGLWMESLYFRIFGDGFLTERLFIITLAITTVSGILFLWRKSFPSRQYYTLSWVPIFLFFINPLVRKCLIDNYLDPIVMCFSLFATIFILEKKFLYVSNHYMRLLISSVLMVIGFLSNGLQVFFPLAVPCIIALIRKDITFKKAFLDTAVLVMFIVGLIGAVFYLQPAALNDIKQYWLTQVVPSTIGNRFISQYTGFGRLRVLLYPFQICFISLLMCAFFWVKGWVKHPNFDFGQAKQSALFYSLIGFTALAPVIVAHRQVTRYVLQSMPFFILAISQFVTPGFAHLTDKLISQKNKTKSIIHGLSIFMVLGSTIGVALFFGSIRRDKNVVPDIRKMSAYIGAPITIQSAPAINTASKEARYFLRYGGISVTPTPNHQEKYFVTIKDNNSKPKGNYKLVPLNTTHYNLYERI